MSRTPIESATARRVLAAALAGIVMAGAWAVPASAATDPGRPGVRRYGSRPQR